MGNPNLGKDVCVPVVVVDSMIIHLLGENLHVEADIAEAIEVLERRRSAFRPCLCGLLACGAGPVLAKLPLYVLGDPLSRVGPNARK
jgi:hypothetical protein